MVGEEEIITIMTMYYRSEEKARVWYETPHGYFTDQFDRPRTPEEMVEIGKGREVYAWLKLALS